MRKLAISQGFSNNVRSRFHSLAAEKLASIRAIAADQLADHPQTMLYTMRMFPNQGLVLEGLQAECRASSRGLQRDS